MNDTHNMLPALKMDPKFSSLHMGVIMGATRIYPFDAIPQAVYDAVRGMADENNQ